MRNRDHYSGWSMALVWFGAVAFGISFWAGLACLIGNFFKG